MLHLSLDPVFIISLFVWIVAGDGWDGAILTYDGYVHLRGCAQLCIAGGGNADQPGIYIGCPNPVYDSCFCRGMEDLAVPVTSLISSCVNSRCSSNQVDLTAAFAVYDGYCSKAGYPHLAQNNAATTTLPGVAGNPTSTVLIVATVTSSSGVNSAATPYTPNTQGTVVTIHSTTTVPPAQKTGSGSGGGTNGGGYGVGDKIALGVGLGVGIPSLVVAIASCLGCGHFLRQRRRALIGGSAYS